MNIHYKNETYLIRVVEELPEQGSKGYLYSIRNDNLGVYYRWKANATWEKTEISTPVPDPIDLSTGLEAIDEGNGIGWRLKGRNPDNYGNIGLNAIDLGASNSPSTTVGATGFYSTVGGGYENKATNHYSTVGGGDKNTASGFHSTVGGGNQNEASGSYSTVDGGINNTASGSHSTVGGGNQNEASGGYSIVGGGYQNEASGRYSTVSGGWQNIAKTFGEFLGGLWSTIKEGNATAWIGTDRIFGIGNGKSLNERSDAFNVYKNGVAELPSVTNSLIDVAGPKTIPTKEWVENNQKLTQDELEGIQNANNLNAANPAATMDDLPTVLELGETNTEAYRGDRGKIAYDHSQEVTGNPHNVNASDVGLGNVDDTSDIDKPISTATQNALDDKTDNTNFTDHTSDQLNPHNVTKTQVGLSNVDNTSDLDKPISTAQAAANTVIQNDVDKKVYSNTTDEPTGSDKVVNIVSLTQAEYDAGTVKPDTFYIITDA